MKWIGALLALLAVEAQVMAGGCRSYGYSYSYPTYYEKKIYITEYVPFLAYVPVGLATYIPTPPPPAVPLTALTAVPAAAATPLAAPTVQVPAVPVVDPCAASTAALRAEIASLRADMAALRGPLLKAPEQMPPPAPKEAAKAEAPQAKQTGLGVLQNRCAKCHESAKAEKDGGGFAMLKDGVPVPLNDKQVVGVYRMVLKGAMPPEKEGRLNEQEGQALLEYLDGLAKK